MISSKITVKMTLLKKKVCFLFFLLFLCCVFASPAKQKSNRRLHLPFLGLGPTCHGCPPHFCDDDPAIIHGYCCGCARFYDVLPVKCAPYLRCPLNGQGLCDDYEYMMHCCCNV